jgi:uncharacterized protein (DUF1778 family)
MMPGGRPRKKEGRKDTTLTIRLTAEEKAALYREAKDQGRRLSDYVRTVVLASFYDYKERMCKKEVARVKAMQALKGIDNSLFSKESLMELIDPPAKED